LISYILGINADLVLVVSDRKQFYNDYLLLTM